MYRATTPKITFLVEDDVDLTEAVDVYMTLSNPKTHEKLIEKHGSDVVLEAPNKGFCILTQAESLALPIGTADIQINWLYEVDGDLMRGASDHGEVFVKRNNKEEVVVIE